MRRNEASAVALSANGTFVSERCCSKSSASRNHSLCSSLLHYPSRPEGEYSVPPAGSRKILPYSGSITSVSWVVEKLALGLTRGPASVSRLGLGRPGSIRQIQSPHYPLGQSFGKPRHFKSAANELPSSRSEEDRAERLTRPD